jgi:hypothetical protein
MHDVTPKSRISSAKDPGASSMPDVGSCKSFCRNDHTAEPSHLQVTWTVVSPIAKLAMPQAPHEQEPAKHATSGMNIQRIWSTSYVCWQHMRIYLWLAVASAPASHVPE